jgi:hypothetical protein
MTVKDQALTLYERLFILIETSVTDGVKDQSVRAP